VIVDSAWSTGLDGAFGRTALVALDSGPKSWAGRLRPAQRFGACHTNPVVVGACLGDAIGAAIGE
jgi:hypothetical protein